MGDVPDGHLIAAGSAEADLFQLVSDNDAVVRVRIALNPHAPEAVVHRLVKDPVWFVRWVAARRPDVDAIVRGEVLASLVSDESVGVRMLLAGDPQTPESILRALASDSDERVRTLVWEHPAASEEMRAAAQILGVRQPDPDENLDEYCELNCLIAEGLAIGIASASVAHPSSPTDVHRLWSVGESGPGGGVVFFDAGERQWWGRYLEAAPVGWAGSGDIDPRVIWSGTDPSGVAGPLSTGTGVGWGWSNTWRIIEHYPVSAAWMAASFRGGGFTDWFLPSKDELDALYTWCRDVGRDGVFWSSSVYEGNGGGVWTHDFSPGRPAVRHPKEDPHEIPRSPTLRYPEPEIETGQPLSVCPIRAF